MEEADYHVYLRRAAEVEDLARCISLSSDREALLGIAHEWRRLAEGARQRAGLPREDDAA